MIFLIIFGLKSLSYIYIFFLNKVVLSHKSRFLYIFRDLVIILMRI